MALTYLAVRLPLLFLPTKIVIQFDFQLKPTFRIPLSLLFDLPRFAELLPKLRPCLIVYPKKMRSFSQSISTPFSLRSPPSISTAISGRSPSVGKITTFPSFPFLSSRCALPTYVQAEDRSVLHSHSTTRRVVRWYLWAGAEIFYFYICFRLVPPSPARYVFLCVLPFRFSFSMQVLHGIDGQNGSSFAQFVSTVRRLAQGDAEQQGVICICAQHSPIFITL